MQKDVHFYLTYALARKVGICAKDARLIAWADQFTDDNHKAELHGMRTQCAVYKDWYDRTVQHDVIVPFHFIPGDGDWLVTPDSTRAQFLVEKALNNLFRLGIALHTLQDTFSHQGFTGWDEKANAVFWFDYIDSPMPNVGHASLFKNPDIANLLWQDLRTGKWIDNRKRVIAAAKATYDALQKLYDQSPKTNWPEIKVWLEVLLEIEGRDAYDIRKSELSKFAGDKKLRYSKLKFEKKYKSAFIDAARCHLGEFFGTFDVNNHSQKNQVSN